MTLFICKECGYGSASWFGRCPDCGGWNTFVEREDISDRIKNREEVKKVNLLSLEKINFEDQKRLVTGIFEFDRVVGGGLVFGEVLLLTGEPGVGKSTLVLQLLNNYKTLYISGEESATQVKARAQRAKINCKNILITEDVQVEGIIQTIEKLEEKVNLLVVDSIQTLYSKDIDSPAGSIAQLKEVTFQLIRLAKTKKIAIILIGHVTKEGLIAGPKILEHMVDCVLNFEGEKISNYRILRALKNRFGSTEEIGIFEMTNSGFKEIKNPLAFLDKPKINSPGKAVVGIIEGKRPLFFEIQSLVVPSSLAVPRRVISGFDYNKALLLLAVARKNLSIPVEKFDIYINIVGGVSIKSTAADFGVVSALVSSFKNKAVPNNSVFIGEVSLLGEIRKAFFQEKIINEAKRLGFSQIFSSENFSSIKKLNQLF